MAKKHLVLGASQGIGFAYAAHMAAHGDHLTLVARRPAQLMDAKAKLLLEGAASVEILSGDLLDSGFRAKLKSLVGGFDSILVSGPSPSIGGMEITANSDWETLTLNACRTCLVYPVEILEWAVGPGLVDHGRLILVSSASVTAAITDTPFLLSRLLRAVLQELIPVFELRFGTAAKALHLWAPALVLTQLSVAYAAKLVGHEVSEDAARNILSNHFGIADFYTAEGYVEFELGRMK